MIANDQLEKLKYPIGKFIRPEVYTEQLRTSYISEIERFPSLLKQEVIKLSGEQLDAVYRPGGWTVRQVVHHCADSHMNALIRFKLALTENKPTIKPYAENLFAELGDAKHMRIQPSLEILNGIHNRWVTLLQNMTIIEFDRMYVHPEYGKEFSLNEATGMYAWHCGHHLSHITMLKKQKNWK